MRHPLLSALSLSALLVACAHDRGKENANTTSAESARADATDRGENMSSTAEHPGKGEGSSDVDVPVHRQRGRMASAGGDLPSDAPKYDADNTGINERDRDNNNVTPMDQGNSEIDIDLTQRIRKSLMQNDSLSFTAKNVKVITRDGQVVLRGPVKTEEEKKMVYRAAINEAGTGRVTNQLEVEKD